ncbi:MAG: HDOD domain-containing protein [candidate division Zixibacteria bacterium]|nr:HDOD domain-containing protein [candidate division Zixibacteria bacterium]
MERDKIVESIQKSKQLFTIPQVLGEMLEIMENEDSSVNDIANVIMKDPTLTVRVLNIANSSFYKRTEEISTVNQAVLTIGANAVKSLALSASILNLSPIRKDDENYARDPKMYWKHSLETGLGANLLAQELGHSSPEEALVAGLIHDLGILFLENQYPEEYEIVIERIKNGEDIIDSERMVFGIDHCEVGGLLGEKWKIPQRFLRCITDHHAVEKTSGAGNDVDQLVIITALANNLSRYDIEVYSDNLEKKLNNVQILNNLLDFPREKLDQVRIRMMEEMLDAASKFDIDIGNPTELLNQANAELCDIYLMVENLFRERQELSQKLLSEERHSGAIESLNVAVSTLAHYINNATMAISGRSQLLTLLLSNGQLKDNGDKLKKSLEVIDSAVIKIGATLEELREFTNMEGAKYYDHSKALNIEEQLKKRIESLTAERKADNASVG